MYLCVDMSEACNHSVAVYSGSWPRTDVFFGFCTKCYTDIYCRAIGDIIELIF